jgi:hypothetical protein
MVHSPEAPRRSWLGRNWKWLVPLGCLTPILACAGIFIGVMSALKSTDAYSDPVDRATANEEVKAALGEPIKTGFWVNGSVEITGASGKSDLAIPISGPKGSGTLYVKANRNAGKWEYSTLEVAPDSGPRINLLDESEKKKAP